jgi:hypothetical protein
MVAKLSLLFSYLKIEKPNHASLQHGFCHFGFGEAPMPP